MITFRTLGLVLFLSAALMWPALEDALDKHDQRELRNSQIQKGVVTDITAYTMFKIPLSKDIVEKFRVDSEDLKREHPNAKITEVSITLPDGEILDMTMEDFIYRVDQRRKCLGVAIREGKKEK